MLHMILVFIILEKGEIVRIMFNVFKEHKLIAHKSGLTFVKCIQKIKSLHMTTCTLLFNNNLYLLFLI